MNESAGVVDGRLGIHRYRKNGCTGLYRRGFHQLPLPTIEQSVAKV
jgi:hypothetical protein